jgi:D-alanyl-D-alanine carboxypeptidase
MNDNRNRRPGGGNMPGKSGSSPGGPDKRPPVRPAVRPAIRRVRRRSFAGPIIAAFVLTLIVILAIIALFMLLSGKLELPGGLNGDADITSGIGEETSGLTETDKETAPDTGAQAEPVTEPVTEPETQKPAGVATGYKTISLDNADVHKGDLILVNYMYAYAFPEKKNTITIYGNKNNSYKLSTSQLEVSPQTLDALNAMMKAFAGETGKYDVFVRNAYRSLEEQKTLFNARVEAYGEENAKKYLAQPGYSEHHTGMCFDLGIYTDEGKAYELDGISGYADWFTSNCAKFGFVNRFPDNKASITGVTSDKWHFRYVGQVHAETMNALNLCLEEYIDELRKYTYNSDHLLVTTSSGDKYEIYYQYASGTDKTDVPVPENLPYSISGDNSEGFIVTVSLS